MNPISRLSIIFSLLASFALLVSCWVPAAEAAFYRYTDKNGVVHFTDRFESIPPEYRNQIKEYKETMPPEAPPPQEKGASKEPGAADRESQLRETEQKKKEAEAKAAQEKAAQEAKQKARQEIQKQIADLQEQIAAKNKEAGTLRTNWMVYDRYRVTQLNEEVASLEKQIEALQKELSELP
jgi:type IV secretory pathway VirB10-like protein